MRPLRLLLSLCSGIIAITLLLYIGFGSSHEGVQRNRSASQQKKAKFRALFSFTSPGSLFPPSAIISLTDDNSTFFLARPAAFGPALPSNGLSSPLWIGSGFGDDAMGRGELGCSDVPGWKDGEQSFGALGLKKASDAKTSGTRSKGDHKVLPRTDSDKSVHDRVAKKNDGTDDHLHYSLSASSISTARGADGLPHADIQSLQEAAEITGKVVLLKRGGCGFLEKVKWAQRRGGVAVIVGDDVRGGGLVRMYAHGDTSNVTIPSLFTSHTTAHLLSSLLPNGGLVQNLSSEDAARLKLIKGGKGGKKNKNQDNPTSSSGGGRHSTGTPAKGWLYSIPSAFAVGHSARTPSKDDSRRPPSSGKLEWVMADNLDEDQKPVATRSVSSSTGQTPAPQRKNGGNVVSSSDEYTKDNNAEARGWLHKLIDGKSEQSLEVNSISADAKSVASSREAHSSEFPKPPIPHEGLWVTLTPTNMSTSPFFDTLLVLVVSPLVTLTVVYALLLLRSRIRRRRWRAPKSLVERLPVRTYHTISDVSPAPTPTASSPTTPLLQHSPPRSNPSLPRPRSGAELEVPATSSSVQQNHRTPEEEKRESGLAAWRRRYGGRQKECVVCLEEYEDGISRVMSLPCGHEFHEDCITPWLVTRRRTCPICKGDVVRSLSQSYYDRTSSPVQSPRFSDDIDDDLQAQAAETRNDSPSASRPLPIAGNLEADMEANWGDEDEEGGRDVPRERTSDLSSSLSQVSSSVATTIWRGFEVVGRATGFNRRQSREEVDRDR